MIPETEFLFGILAGRVLDMRPVWSDGLWSSKELKV